MRKSLTLLTLATATLVGSCGPGSSVSVGPDGTSFNAGGSFLAEGTNILEGMDWQLNRPIRLEFNHAVDPTSINFGSIQIRAELNGNSSTPVTGTFELEAGSGGRVILFRPACPTDDTNSNGAFLPGGYSYELFLPTQSNSPTVLRDTQGRSLEVGLRRTFQTPQPSQPQFLDRVAGPPVATLVEFPTGLNLFTDPNPVVAIQFNQAIDGRSDNLNTTNVSLLYSQDEVGTAGENTFPAANQVPGTLVLVQNCSDAGSTVEFHVTGIMPVNRKLSLRLSTSFTDLVGQANTATVVIGSHTTPSLGDIYDDPTWTETDLAADEFSDSFENTSHLDLDEPLSVPAASIGDGFVSASFEFPGNFVAEDNDFYLSFGATGVIITDSQSVFTDSNNRQHTVQNGVLNVNDFTIASGASLRGRGTNPLVIYATGSVDISGTLNISGNNATWPTSLNSPQFVEGGAGGECGGGRGGDASQIGNAETLRAEDGDAPFGAEGGGGGGGEGGFNSDFYNTGNSGLYGTIVGGGGGGGFARTQNQSVLWDDWPTGNGDWRPYNVDNAGPDHSVTKHSAMVNPDPNDYSDFANAIFGSERGVRGSARTVGYPAGAYAVHGMEDALDDANALGNTYDPSWTVEAESPFWEGSPTRGADRGEAGPSIFTIASLDRRFLSDFYGSRLMTDGSVNEGVMLAPWAGSGGGGGGDSMLIEVWDRDGDGITDPLLSFYPVVPFQRSGNNNSDGWDTYRKGAGGGGGAGQLIIMSIGNIKIGSAGLIQANGGIGFSGESLTVNNQGVSGSGGGSGGHIILHTSGKLDLRDIDVGSATIAGQVPNLTPVNNIQAFGGRRGWAAPILQGNDGNPTFGTGRGGSGANGIIQIHVPDPSLDILWHPDARVGIAAYLAAAQFPTDETEEVLDLVSAPRAYNLVPFYSSRSRIVSEWIDTGGAELRLGDDALYPDYGHPTLSFDGVSTTVLGRVNKSGTSVAKLSDVATGSTGDVTITAYGLTIPGADTIFAAVPHFLRSPNLLIGYDVMPDSTGDVGYEIVDVSYNPTTKQMVITTSLLDGPMTFALNSSNPVWSVKEKFFRIATSGVKDGLPDSTDVFIQFQVADDINAPVGGAGTWHQDLTPALVTGKRFIRYRVTFEANAGGGQMDLSSPLPIMEYIKIPFIW
ncbi:MAG: hypothetical protein GY747_03410 [Planctomycetes bacterium]|nr:hypothetical protein [Planctomycetota bacterium]MCP4770903.1 hypothetical protein [Planctomycetota bacterium]MCP4862272.1 hypothetical protein [Planctomycetota bacterium]